MKSKIFLILTVLLVATCASLTSFINKRPEVKIKDFDIKAISFKDVDLLFNIQISNPYPVGIKLNRVKFKVDIENKQLFSTVTPKGFQIKAGGTATTPLDVNLIYMKIIKIIRDYKKKEYLNCKISGEISIFLPKIPGLPKTYAFPFTLNKKIPAIKPKISIANFKVKAPTLKEIEQAIKKAGKKIAAKKISDIFGNMLKGKSTSLKNIKKIGLKDLDLKLKINFDLKIKNDSRAKLFFKNLSYNFFMNNYNVFNGNTKDSRSVGNTLIMHVVNELSSKNLAQSVLDVFKKRSGSFKLKGQTFIKLPDSIKRDPLPLRFDEKGLFKM